MTLEQEFGYDLVYGAKLHEEMLLLLDTLDGMKGTDVLPPASDYVELAHRALSEKHYTTAQCAEMLAHVEPYKLRAFVQVHASIGCRHQRDDHPARPYPRDGPRDAHQLG